MDNFKDIKIKQLDTLIEITGLINSTLDPYQVRKKAVELAAQLLNTETGSLLLIDQEKDDLFFEIALGEKGDTVKSIRLKRGHGITGWVAEHGRPVIANNVDSDPRFFKGIDKRTKFQTRNMVCVPVQSKEKTLGVLSVINKIQGDFENDDMVILYAFANQVAIALENARLYKDAATDDLTKLYRRNYFELRLKEEIDRAKRYKHSLTLLFIDIDFFKKINDRYGHPVGDEVLKGVAEKLKEAARLSDFAARYGGEEFVLLLPYISHKKALQIGERLRKNIENNDFKGIKITISIGLGYFNGKDLEMNYRRMLEITDKALYKAKNNGRNRIETAVIKS
jgi:diguanylate cyclase (GGDEF)-like protein